MEELFLDHMTRLMDLVGHLQLNIACKFSKRPKELGGCLIKELLWLVGLDAEITFASLPQIFHFSFFFLIAFVAECTILFRTVTLAGPNFISNCHVSVTDLVPSSSLILVSTGRDPFDQHQGNGILGADQKEHGLWGGEWGNLTMVDFEHAQ